MRALEPGAFVRSYLAEHALAPGDVTVLALGKAAVPMALGARAALGERIRNEIVVAPSLEGQPKADGWLESDHPVPTARSEAAARALLTAAKRANGHVLALISGGGSALAALPAGTLTLEATGALCREIYEAGADIHKLNTVRKHLDDVKGGRLAQAASVPITTLVLSDVVGDLLSSVASGPTMVDPSSFADAVAIAERYADVACHPQAMQHLRAGAQGRLPETLKEAREGDVQRLLAGMRSLATVAGRLAEEHGVAVDVAQEVFDGDVESVAANISESALETPDQPGLWVASGESTIALCESPGTGGRAHHLALLMAQKISGGAPARVLVAGSDGIDGKADAAGAVVDEHAWDAIAAAGIDPAAALRSCDSARALAAVGAEVVTGPTGVNHADLVLVERGVP